MQHVGSSTAKARARVDLVEAGEVSELALGLRARQPGSIDGARVDDRRSIEGGRSIEDPDEGEAG